MSKTEVETLIQNPRGFEEPIRKLPLGSTALAPSEIAARLRKSTLYIGWFFKCNHCDNWHLNFGAGFPVSEDGVFATCHHVVVPPGVEMREGYLVAIDCDGRIHQVEHVMAIDQQSDCALVKIAGV